ncbi:M15 family metallopeptidase [Alkalihalobacillus pseudalcaliphilus]|uniref:M15 family metallopeptidase n=1 Tax=Alkalihalobacillus pseudalcaliphilus TaxID=79884 RepID=UPI00064DC79C|nr:M15 family metallopeptidase [Alkalihalobacillus pseudalcaliphilus]KMK76240.1 hypothetical protein AB990_13590 [Alkalihalobacillus pseudalcaliphilus]
MKKWAILLLSIVAIIAISHLLITSSEINIEPLASPKLAEIEDWEEMTLSQSEISKGDLLLVNHEHPISELALPENVINLYDQNQFDLNFGLMNTDLWLPERMVLPFIEMIEEANSVGIHDFLMTSGFRGFASQEQLYEEKGSEFALPAGYSEHHLGLALDVGSKNGLMSEATEGKWLAKNAWKHGFILRYPEHKTDITGISYEPWHFRYVGLPHSAIMYEHDLVLEEYIEYVSGYQEGLLVTVNAKDYLILYYSLDTDEKQIHVPVNYPYEISGTNVEGIIVTIDLNV